MIVILTDSHSHGTQNKARPEPQPGPPSDCAVSGRVAVSQAVGLIKLTEMPFDPRDRDLYWVSKQD